MTCQTFELKWVGQTVLKYPESVNRFTKSNFNTSYWHCFAMLNKNFARSKRKGWLSMTKSVWSGYIFIQISKKKVKHFLCSPISWRKLLVYILIVWNWDIISFLENYMVIHINTLWTISLTTSPTFHIQDYKGRLLKQHGNLEVSFIV